MFTKNAARREQPHNAAPAGSVPSLRRQAARSVLLALSALPEDKKPSACLGCRSCEAVCPQNIKISEILSRFSGLLAK